MSPWSRRKKINIFFTIIVLITFFVAGILFSIFYEKPSCSDGILNNSEFGIDCGGNCEKQCELDPKGLLDIWTRTFEISDGVYSAVAYVENQNIGLYVPSIQFEIVLYDKKNKIITRASNVTKINSNGITPIFVPHIITKERDAVRATFRFTEEPRFVKTDENFKFIFSNKVINFTENEPPIVSVVVRNDSNQSINKADFVVIVYDENGTAIASSRTFVENFLKDEKRILEYTWINPFVLHQRECETGKCPINVRNVEIFPIIYNN